MMLDVILINKTLKLYKSCDNVSSPFLFTKKKIILTNETYLLIYCVNVLYHMLE